MGLSDDVAIIALVVSLVALMLSVILGTQQILGTADGYRRCADSVIDVWSELRSRNWVWSEFRLETRFVTPELVLVTPHELSDAKIDSEIYSLTSPELLQEECRQLDQTVHKSFESKEFVDRKNKAITKPQQSDEETAAEMNYLLSSAVHMARTRRRRFGGLRSLGSTIFSKIHRISSTSSPRAKRKQKLQEEVLVTWLSLLRDVHSLYYSYWPETCTRCTEVGIQTGWEKDNVSHRTGEKSGTESQDPNPSLFHIAWSPEPANADSEQDMTNSEQTDVAVKYRAWTWNFMPPDMVKPLAKSTVGDIVIVLRRMGMHWKTLELDNGKMQADGNGYSVSSTDTRGLGIVLSFSTTGSHPRFPRIIPSRAADKLLCGIVPGCPLLVKKDYQYVRPDGSHHLSYEPGGILPQIGIWGEKRRQIESHQYDEPHNELIVLLCPFLPLPRSSIVSYCFVGFMSSPNPKSVFHYWEGRYLLLQKLEERTKDAKRSTKHEDLTKMFTFWKYLETEYPHDFYGRHACSAINSKQGPAAKEKLVDFCRKAHEYTTAFFRRPELKLHEPHRDGRTKYLHLVAAHASMADKAMERAINALRSRKSEDRTQAALRKRYNFDDTRGNTVYPGVVEVALHYASHLHDPQFGIGTYLIEKHIGFSNEDPFTEDDVEILWWTLMLRGIVWDMGSWYEPDAGLPIPSMFYDNKTPVWIT